jgi:hypothetical protein
VDSPSAITIVNPVNNTNTSDILLDVNYTVADVLGFSGCWYSNDSYLVNTSLTDCGTNVTDVLWAQGWHNVTIWVNDTVGNLNKTSFTFLIDNSTPSVSLAKSAGSDTTVTITVSIGDSTYSTIPSSCSVDKTGATVSGTGTTQTLTDSNLNCGTHYTYTVSCADSASNSASGSITILTDSCGSSSSGGSGGGGTSTWTNTYNYNSQELSEQTEPITKTLSSHSRVKVMVEGEEHYVGVKSVTASSASIEIASTPQTAEINVGETKKFDIDADGSYEIQVILNKIVGTSADLSISYIDEKTVAGEVTSGTESDENAGTFGEGITETVKSNKVWFIVGGIVILLVIILVVFFVLRNNKRKY